ncbi:hypothetical protein [Paracoccus sediminis]|nr:hypothetical protein [Paracoccus sediminis]SNR38369.1 hypothetical protein SAMN06265378_10390 [Paracoccus sediminis]
MRFGASDRAIRMVPVHDLVEIDMGDAPLHSAGDEARDGIGIRVGGKTALGAAPSWHWPGVGAGAFLA